MLQRNKKINDLILKLILVGIIGMILVASLSIVNLLKKKKGAEKEIEKINDESVRLEEKKIELSSLLNYFQDQSFLEKEARRRLNYQKPGEKVVIIADQMAGADIPDLSSNNEQTQKKDREGDGRNIISIFSNPKEWLKFLFK